MNFGIGMGLQFRQNAGGGSAPVNTVAPAVTGTPVVGQILSCSTGTWTGNPTPTYTYQWKRNGVNIGGATANTYTLVQADAGNTANISCTVTATNTIGNASANSNTVVQIFDANAYALITNGSFVDTTQVAVENQYFISTKAIDPISNAIACYGIVGGTAAFHKWNWYDPQDADASYRLSFTGGVTHTVNGMQGNGLSGNASTFIFPNLVFPTTDFTWIMYSRTNQARNEADLSASDSTLRGLSIAIKFGDNNTYFQALNSAEISAGNVVANTGGCFIFKRAGSTFTIKRNDVTIYTNNSVTGDFRVNQLLKLMCQSRTGSANAFFSTKQYTHFEIRKTALTAGQETAFYQAVLAKETALGRNV